jgi:FkbM family methyltransferase
MSLHRELVTSKHQRVVIESDDPKAAEHFASQGSYADIVLNQINNDRFYDEIFEGEDDLTILDIGGNVGLFTLYVQDCAKVVYPVEPTPSHFALLKEFTKDYAHVHPQNIALGGSDGVTDFYINEENTTMNSLVNKYGTKVEVQTRTLATLLKELNLDHVDFCKCDIEGSEMVAITDETLAPVAAKIDNWFLEVHRTDNGATWAEGIHENRETIKAIFERAGYGVEYVRHDGLFCFKPDQYDQE